MKSIRILATLLLMGLLAVGCSQEPEMTAPLNQTNYYDKDGTETLGVPTIDIEPGSGFVEGGVGMSDDNLDHNLVITVPTGVVIKQVLLYWSGATTGAPGDDTIALNGTPVQGTLIGGATNFYSNYEFSAFRAELAVEGVVTEGENSFLVTDFNFDHSNGTHEENNGVSMLVIYDDGTTSELTIRDGLDLAFWNFEGLLEVTDPQTFTFAADTAERTADLLLFVGSVFINRPNQIKVTTSAGDQYFDNLLNSTDGLTWDSMILPVTIPPEATSLTVELISTPTADPLGASMSWVGAGLSVPTSPPPELGCLGDYVWVDANMDGIQDDNEMGREGVTVYLFDCDGNELGNTVTDMDGMYMFCELEEGQYMIQFMLPGGYEFSPQDMGGDDELDSDADPATGLTVCIDLDEGEHDLTWDAGIFMPVDEGCTLTIGFWKNHTGLGPQADVISQYLPITLGDAGGSKSLDVTDRYVAVDVLKQRTYGQPNNGITKLYAQLLAAKLNFAAGASDNAVADYVADADAFLADHDHDDWGDLTEEEADNVMMWHGAFDDYNNGDIGPGHCENGDRVGGDEGKNKFN
jgi:hypothetical protein